MKKVEFRNSKGLKLIGVLHTPKEATLSAVIISHGFASNKDRDRLVGVATALSENGIAALRFDFGASGESDDRDITVGDEADDLRSAISYLQEQGYKQLGLLGESLGGLVSLLAFSKIIKAMVLWAPVTKAKDPHLIQKEEIEQGLDDKGYIIHRKDDNDFRIPRKYFEERANLNRQETLEKVDIPVLILHGGADATIPINDSKEAIELLPAGSKLEAVNSNDHTMETQMQTIIPKTVDWFKTHLT